jgi:hypothetical protein
MQAITNSEFPNRIQLLCAPFTGPFTQLGPLGAFNPVRDLQVYVDGTYTPIQSSAFDAANNRYLLYTANAIDYQGIVQVIYHMPNPPFLASGGVDPAYGGGPFGTGIVYGIGP